MLYYQSPAYLVLDFNVEKLPERKKGGLAWSSGLASLAACPCGEPWPPQGGVRLLPPVLVARSGGCKVQRGRENTSPGDCLQRAGLKWFWFITYFAWMFVPWDNPQVGEPVPRNRSWAVPWHRVHLLCTSGAAHAGPRGAGKLWAADPSRPSTEWHWGPSPASLYRQQALEEAIVMLMQDLPGFHNLGSLPFAPSYTRLFFLSWLLLLLWLHLTPVRPFYHSSSFSLGITRSCEWLNLVFYLQDATVCKLRELALVGFFPFFLAFFFFFFFLPTVDGNMYNMVILV